MRPDDTLTNDSYDAIITYGDSPRDIGPAGESDPRDDIDHAPELGYAGRVSLLAELDNAVCCRICARRYDADDSHCDHCFARCEDCDRYYVRDSFDRARLSKNLLCGRCEATRYRVKRLRYRAAAEFLGEDT